MKAIKKTVSVVLAVMMILCTLTAMSFGASAAETNSTGKITVSSNLSSPVAYNYDENSKQVTVTYYLQADNMIIDVQAYCTYDTSVLKLADTNDGDNCIPVISTGNAVINLDNPGKISFTSSSLTLFDFKTKGVFFTATFDIIGKGDADIDLNVEVISGTAANSFDEIETSDKIQNVFFNKVTPSGVKFSQSAEVKNPVSEATIYFAAPKGTGKDIYTWRNVKLYYGESTTMTNNKFIDMKATGKVVSIKSVGSLTKVVPGDWEVFSATLTAEQVAAIDKANRVGFVNAANYNVRTDYRYAYNVTGDASIAAYFGKTFVIDGCAGSSEVNSYTGKWIDDTGHEVAKEATIYFAAPKGTGKDIYTWRNVKLYYGESIKMEKNNYIDMKATGKVATVASVGSLTKVVPGDWAVFSVALTAAQIAAIDSASRVGFVNADNYNVRTDYRVANNVTGDASIAAYDGKMFEIDGCAGSSEVNSYTGKWIDDTGHESAKKATIYFAAPKGTGKDIYTWKNVKLYYGESTTMTNNKFIDMTATGRVETVKSVGTLTKVVPGDWEVFSAALTADQIAAIDAANRVGFVNADNYNVRTDFRFAYNVTGDASIAAYNGKTFVIDGCAGASEVNSYTGSWK